MKKFKVGDKVKILSIPNGHDENLKKITIGDIVRITRIDAYIIECYCDKWNDHIMFAPKRLELVDDIGISDVKIDVKKCTCGAASVGSNMHSDYCDINKEDTKKIVDTNDSGIEGDWYYNGGFP